MKNLILPTLNPSPVILNQPNGGLGMTVGSIEYMF